MENANAAGFDAQYARAVAKYSPEMWAVMHPRDMLIALQREVDELGLAIWKTDLDGEHGIVRESLHVQVVAQRIREEMARRSRK